MHVLLCAPQCVTLVAPPSLPVGATTTTPFVHAAAQKQAMRRGFNFLQGWTLLLEGFTPKQRRHLVSGNEDLSAASVQRVLVPEGWDETADAESSSSAGLPTVECLHQVLRRFEAHDKRAAERQHGGSRPPSLLRRFVQFATGRGAITQGMAITVQRLESVGGFPEASTCTAVLRLPDCRDVELLHSRLHTAISADGAMAD